MQRRAFVEGGIVSALATLAACRRVPTDLPVGPGAVLLDASRDREPPAPTSAGSDADADARFAALAGFCDGVAPPDADELADHLQRLQGQLSTAGHAALVVEPSPTMTWLSGAHWGRSERPFLLVVPARGEPWFVCPAFEEGTARAQLPAAVLHVWQEDEDPYAVVARRLAPGRGSLAVDGETRAFIVEGLRRAWPGAVVDGDGVVAACRMRKSEPELARLRRANEATKAALQSVAPLVHAGMTQSEIAALVQTAQTQAGLTAVWALALVGPNAAFPHGTDEDRPVAQGDLVLVDTGGTLHGYRSDITRTWAVGSPSLAAAKAWTTVAQAQRAAMATMRPGVRCSDVDAAARAVIAAAGYGERYSALSHRLGHGIGLQVHEPPYLRPGNDRPLAVGMTMSNEPGIYRRGEFGVRIEDIVAITADGIEVFGPQVRSLEEPFG